MGKHAIRRICACILGLFFFIESDLVSATPIAPTVYRVSDYGTGSRDHGVWFRRFDSTSSPTRFTFLSGATFSVNGTAASLMGSIRDKSNANHGFDLSLVFEKISVADVASRNLLGKCEQGGCDTSGWHYYDLVTGMFTGTGGLTGLNLNLIQRPANGSYPWQVGFGANSKNFHFGAAMWFDWEIDGQNNSMVSVCTSSLDCGRDYHGDFNINLSAPQSVALFVAGLVCLGGLARRQRGRSD